MGWGKTPKALEEALSFKSLSRQKRKKIELLVKDEVFELREKVICLIAFGEGINLTTVL